MEGGRDQYWACGLDHRVAITTNVSFMPGDNQLGMLLAAVRHSILKTIREFEENDHDDDDDEDTESASKSIDNLVPTSQINQTSQLSEDNSLTAIKATTSAESSGAGDTSGAGADGVSTSGTASSVISFCDTEAAPAAALLSSSGNANQHETETSSIQAGSDVDSTNK